MFCTSVDHPSKQFWQRKQTMVLFSYRKYFSTFQLQFSFSFLLFSFLLENWNMFILLKLKIYFSTSKQGLKESNFPTQIVVANKSPFHGQAVSMQEVIESIACPFRKWQRTANHNKYIKRIEINPQKWLRQSLSHLLQMQKIILILSEEIEEISFEIYRKWSA